MVTPLKRIGRKFSEGKSLLKLSKALDLVQIMIIWKPDIIFALPIGATGIWVMRCFTLNTRVYCAEVSWLRNQSGWEGRRAGGGLGNSHLQTTWQEAHQGGICSNPLHNSQCYCQKLCRNKSIRVGCLHPPSESLESPHLPPMTKLAPTGHHFVTGTAPLYLNHIFPGTC